MAVMIRIIASAMIGLLLLLQVGCGESKPLKLGFIGGTSGRVADLGVAGRNGVILAVEKRNAAGGVNGRSIELLLKDDKQDAATAKKAAQELANSDVEAILGPMTSAMALEVITVSEPLGTLTMGITVTTNDLAGKDDLFFRTLSPTMDHAAETAKYLRAHKRSRRAAIIYDLKNKSYTESWGSDFSLAFEKLGGDVVGKTSFVSSDQVRFEHIASDALKGNPDLVVMVVNSVDAALLAKQLRTMDSDIQLATSEWAGTERLIELGGRYVENTVVPQYFDRNSHKTGYLAFYDAYYQRFGHAPGFPGMVGFNAANVILDSLEARQKNESLKQTILRIKTFPGVSGQVVFDAFGDAKSKTYLTEVVDGQFRLGVTH